MKRSTPLLAVLLVLALAAAACTSSEGNETTTTTAATTTTTEPPATTTTSTTLAREAPLDPDGFYLVVWWHQHQPLYPKDADGVVTRPWVRVHATKDYYDMAAMVQDYPNVQFTYNLTPVLLLQLEELANGTKDVYWVHTEIPADELTEEQREFILARFFDVNPLIVARFPRFQELADLRTSGGSLSADDIRDLQVLFNLAWTDPDFLAEEPLASLVAKERDFDEADKQIVLDEHLRIIREVIPIHRELWESGQIEVTTTPLAHPILPLITDTGLATRGDPTALMPDNRYVEPIDAGEHVRRGLDVAERLLGTRPTGMWPGEGSVAQLVMSLFSREGVRWVGTGEHVLRPSLGLGSGPFERAADDTVLEADSLYRPWNAQLQRNDPVAMFFRDIVLSDLVGFQYSGMTGDAAADDFMERLAAARDRLNESGAEGPHVVSVILDGENAWESYPNDGKDFLDAMMQRLSEADWVRTITPSQYVEAFGDTIEPLDEVFPGAWFSSNYATWIGEEEEATAWDYLYRTRQDLADAIDAGLDETAAEAAYETMLFAEGSDWFWWYGADQSSGNDDYFDTAYRELLGQVYDLAGMERPTFVSIPIIPETPTDAVRSADDVVAITIDNTISDDEWSTGGQFLAGGDLVESVEYGYDARNMYLRVDFTREVLGDDAPELDIYLGVPSASTKRAATLAGEPLGFGASHLISWRGADPVTATAPVPLVEIGRESRLPDPEGTLPVGFDGISIEFAVPLTSLSAVETGDRVLFRIAERNFGVEEGLVPVDGPGLAVVPDISDVEVILAVDDPQADDHGPGAYTYPEDPVFASGIFDLTSFSVGLSGEDVVFTFESLAPIQNVWDSPNGMSTQTFDVYIDKDPGVGTGPRTLIPGRNAALEEGNGWEYGLTVEGWDSAIYVGAPGGTSEETRPTFRVIVLGDRGRVVARVPATVFGDGDPSTWGYAALMLGQEGFPSSGVRRVRDVNEVAEQWRFGGAPSDASNHTRIIDLAWPETGIQEASLSEFTPSTATADELGPDDYARIPLIVP